jgi:hypothetical protein
VGTSFVKRSLRFTDVALFFTRGLYVRLTYGFVTTVLTTAGGKNKGRTVGLGVGFTVDFLGAWAMLFLTVVFPFLASMMIWLFSVYTVMQAFSAQSSAWAGDMKELRTSEPITMKAIMCGTINCRTD